MLLHLVRSKGLSDIAASATGQGFNHVRLTSFGSDHAHRHALGIVHALQLPDEFQSVHDGHVDVTENQVNIVIAQHGEGFSAVGSLTHRLQIDASLPERALHNLPHD